MAITNASLVVSQARGPQGAAGDATAADIAAAIAALKGAVTTANDTLAKIEANLALKASLASPAFTGNPTAATQANGNNSTKLATTGFTQQELSTYAQPLDPLLTSLSNLSTTISGVIQYTAGVASVIAVDTDGTLAANSDTRVASQKAVKTYADALIGANDAMVFKGVIDCSANPNYPAADRGWTYKVSVAGKIGGGSGPNVEVGDMLLCITDGTASGTQAGVGAQWDIIQVNIDGAVTGPASSTSGNVATFNGIGGKVIQDGGKALPTGMIVGTSDSQTLTNKTLTSPAINSPTGIVKGDVGLGNVDNTSDATKNAAAVTLANKTLTAPTINGGAATALTGLAVRSTGAAFDLTFASTEVLTAGRTLTITLNDAARTLNYGGNFTIAGAASLPAIAQGDLWYGSAAGVISALAKNASATRYLSNGGTSNNPSWAQINLTNGVTGVLPVANFTTGTPTGSKFVRDDGVLAVPAGGGNVSGPGSSTDTGLARYNGTSGTTLEDSGVTVDASNNLTVPGNISIGATKLFEYSSLSAVPAFGMGRASSVAANGTVANAVGAGLVYYRDMTNGGYALVAYDGGSAPVIISGTTNFTLSDPGGGGNKWFISGSPNNGVMTNRYGGAVSLVYFVVGAQAPTIV